MTVDMEKLAEKVHQVYCEHYKKVHQGEEYWTRGDYSKLTELDKEYDRVVIRAVIEAIT